MLDEIINYVQSLQRQVEVSGHPSAAAAAAFFLLLRPPNLKQPAWAFLSRSSSP